MHFLMKILLFILIFYLKLNALYTSPLIDPNKALIPSISTHKIFNIEALDKGNIINKSNTNTIYNIKQNNVKVPSESVIQEENYNTIQLVNNRKAIITNNFPTDENQLELINHQEVKHISKQNLQDNTTINHNQYFLYNVVGSNDTKLEPRELTNAEDTPLVLITPSVQYQYPTPNEQNISSLIDQIPQHLKISNADSNEVYENLDSGGYNNSEVERIFLKYENDNGIKCLLDDFKDGLIWWAFSNGSLRNGPAQLTNSSCYVDMSSTNITEDDTLFHSTKYQKLIKGPKIIAFSAANNNLTRAPFRTLTLMNGTLKYLTLRGNEFAAYSQEMQKDAFNRIFNDTKLHPDPSDSNVESFKGVDNACQNQTDCNNTNHTIQQNTNSYPSYYNLNDETYAKFIGGKEQGIAWATFPIMPALLELDISNCHIEYVKAEAFKNFTSLRRLYISHNKMLTIPYDTFLYLPKLQYLDLSFTNVLDVNYQIPLPTLEAVINLIYGVKIQQTTFKHVPELVYLDLSHTKLTRNSAVAFTHLGEKLKYMSLCYTAFPMIGNALFKNTALVALDLSGNPYASYNILDDTFEGVADTLRFLYFESSNIKEMNWLKYLNGLRVLSLSQNNINTVSLKTFSPLKSLEVLDLSSNHVGNWYQRAFTKNENLRLLNLKDNNINIITSEMLKDFQFLQYLSLGDNNFVCDCLLRDLVEVSAANNKNHECARDILQDAQNVLYANASRLGSYLSPNLINWTVATYSKHQLTTSKFREGFDIDKEFPRHIMSRYVTTLEKSYENIKKSNYTKIRWKMHFFTKFYNTLKSDQSGKTCSEPESVLIHDKLNSSTLQFQLLDYEDEHYWCFNETERMHFVQLECQRRALVEDITEELHKLTKYVLGGIGGVIGLFLLGIIIYLKRWHIQYYYSSLKSAALVSVATKDSIDKFNELAEQDPNLVYDIFISYCHEDRQWVLEELLPNVEQSGDISICMHERDFQIGVTIVDNIISCMDRSRALMLIISANFLLSHWCQFEMYLAQHRIFEASKEHLIIVFLEDIPRSKRPKSLQYLMDVKTYVKWPTDKGKKKIKPEERKLFWKRLKRSLVHIGLQPSESTA